MGWGVVGEWINFSGINGNRIWGSRVKGQRVKGLTWFE